MTEPSTTEARVVHAAALLPAGAETTWTVHETLRKVYLLRP